MNILFIMTDQQRVDYLSIYGNRVLQTPTMDQIGKEGTVFTKAHVQSAVCGPSRACFYTGRYVHTHRSRWNDVPLPITEKTMGHYFEEGGYRAAVIGKTHMYAEHPKPAFVKEECQSHDRRRLTRTDSVGFEYITGAAETPAVPNYDYLQYLQSRGYPGEGQEIISRTLRPPADSAGKYEDDSRRPAAVSAEDSEAHYLTDRAIKFMRESNDRRWLLHLSFFRPHHPNYAPEPYNQLFSEDGFPSPVRSPAELGHPLFGEFRLQRNQTKGDVHDERHCLHWRAVYAGLIKEIDDNLQRLFAFMDEAGLMDQTMIIFTSDHGELAGDHWFFEKEICYHQSHHVPLMIRHPNNHAGRVVNEFVESVDILPTCLEAAELPIPPGLQGRSLMPLVKGETVQEWRRFTVAEWTFEYYKGATGRLSPEQCHAILYRDDHYSLCHFSDLPDFLFDLQCDPDELHNLAQDPKYVPIRAELLERLVSWQLRTWDMLPARLGRGNPALPYNQSMFV